MIVSTVRDLKKMVAEALTVDLAKLFLLLYLLHTFIISFIENSS